VRVNIITRGGYVSLGEVPFLWPEKQGPQGQECDVQGSDCEKVILGYVCARREGYLLWPPNDDGPSCEQGACSPKSAVPAARPESKRLWLRTMRKGYYLVR
jgi:hypothetical protein